LIKYFLCFCDKHCNTTRLQFLKNIHKKNNAILLDICQRILTSAASKVCCSFVYKNGLIWKWNNGNLD
jgi:hypothetical protein